MRGQVRTAEQKLARIAAKQHGIVTFAEALRAGVTRRQVDRLRANGGLIPVYPGVYRVGHAAPSTQADYLAAVKVCGKGAVLCGRAAAWLLGLIKGNAPPPKVTAPTEKDIKGLKTVRTRRIDDRDTWTWRGIPVTTPARTLVDLAAESDEEELARACHEAGVKHNTTPRQVKAVLKRRPNSKNARRLRRIMEGEILVTLSALERRFVALLRASKLPLPITNKAASGRRVDCRWPHHRLTVELDSYTYHRSRHAWERDRQREREAHARGDDFRRYTHDDVFGANPLMLAELRSLLPVA